MLSKACISLRFAMNFGSPKRLTFLQGNCIGAVFSPDGSRIAFPCVVNRRSDIYVINVDGTGLNKLTQGGPAAGEGAYFAPRFSPDGKHLVCTRVDAFYEEHSDIALLQADGSGAQELTQTRKDDSARFSPDGQHIFFVSARHGQSEIFRMNAEGGEQTRLTYITEEPAHPQWWRPRNMHPVCSPDGAWIVFSSSMYGLPADNRFEIVRIRPDGSAQQRLTHTRGSSSYPLVSPDSKQVAFTSWETIGATRKGKSGLYLVNIDSSNFRCLEESQHINWLGSFSPNGRYLAFDSTRGGGAIDVTRNWDIYLRDLTNDALISVTNNEFLDRKPMFSPDGTQLLFQSDRDGAKELYILDVTDAIFAA